MARTLVRLHKEFTFYSVPEKGYIRRSNSYAAVIYHLQHIDGPKNVPEEILRNLAVIHHLQHMDYPKKKAENA
ncbi:hypothetical protein TNCV_3482571 [Trichonephila clavipes]|nr:hypothetical protein TNCV_3482571 [Trichonephila clavipes]